MSNGYLLAAESDLAAAREIADGFGLDVIDAASIGDPEATGAALAAAANVGLMLSNAAAADAAYVALLQSLAQRLQRAQLIVVNTEARETFAFLPAEWPAMSLEDARARSSELVRRRQGDEGVQDETPRAAPLPVEPPAAASGGAEAEPEAPAPEETPPSLSDVARDDEPVAAAPPEAEQPADEASESDVDTQTFGAEGPSPAPASIPEPQMPPAAEPPTLARPEPQAPEPPRKQADVPAPATTRAPAPSAPADATAFAPKKLRRATPELVRIVVHQPKDLQAVIKAARRIDPRAAPAPQGMNIGDVAIGASVGVALEVRGADCDGTLQRRTWTGEPIDFSFSVQANNGVKQAVFLARVFIEDAQIGVLAFTRNIAGPSKKPASDGDRVRLKRHKRVFLSYSNKDRETVSQIATAYQMAGVEHFWDRASLKSGEEWHPRLRREIDRADLFHLCWSRAAAESEWVKKEAEHALTRRKKNSGKPDVTVQMLDGPPWAPHPAALDSINFDDFVRAAIVGYARGDGA